MEPDVSGDHDEGLLELGYSLVRGEDNVEAVMDEFARHPPCRVEGSRALLDHFALDSLGHERESACVSRWGVGFLFGVGDVFCQLAPSRVVVEQRLGGAVGLISKDLQGRRGGDDRHSPFSCPGPVGVPEGRSINEHRADVQVFACRA